MIPIPQFSPKNSLAGVVAGLFQNNEPGVWFDPSDLSTLYQDAAGTVPVTGVEQPVGLMLDKSKGLVLGPELVTNGTFDSNINGWTFAQSSGGSIAWQSGGSMRVSRTTATTAGYQANLVTAGRWYKITGSATFVSGVGLGYIAVRNGVDAGGSVVLASAATPVAQSGEISFYYLAVSTATVYIHCGVATAASDYDFDNISVRELPGNHAFQSTAASRPVLSARYNLLTNTEALNTQSRSVRAVSHIISFSGTGSITLSGAYTGVLTGTGVNDRVYLQFTPTAGALTLTVAGSVTKAQLEEV